MYRSLGQWAFSHWKTVVAAWVVIVVGVVAASGAAGSGFDSSFEIPESESRDGFDALDEHFGGFGNGQPGAIVFRSERGVDDPEVMAAMTELFDYTANTYPAIGVVSPYDSANTGRPQIAFDGGGAGLIAFADLTISLEIDQVEAGEIGADLRQQADEVLAGSGLADDVQVELGGAMLGGFEPPETELIGLSFAVIVLIVAFGSVLAMGLPIGVAVAGVGTGIGLISLLSHQLIIPDFSLQIGAMIGLGVGIDYALFIVTRYRNALADGYPPIDAVGIAMDTAGRSVIFAGITVVLSLLGMLLIGLAFVAGLGIGAAITVAVTMLASITLLPALLGVVGHRVEISKVRGVAAAGFVSLALFSAGIGAPLPAVAGFMAAAISVLVIGRFIPGLRNTMPARKQKPIRETVSYRWSRVIQHHPWIAMTVGIALLLLLASPVLGLRLGFSDEGNFPEETTTRKAYDLLADGFGPGSNGPILVTVEPDAELQFPQLMALGEAIAATPGVASVSPPIPNNPQDPPSSSAALIQIIPETSPQDEATEELVKTLREEVIPPLSDNLDVSVTGAVPANIDFTLFLANRIVVFFVVVLALSFLLLMAVFRSLVVPLKAVIMNVLSIAASYGIVVAIFQWGWMGSLFGVAPAPIEPFIPMMLFAIVFGLSMDYEVFLLSRIKEEYERTGDPQNSVADGLAATARVITAAAAIMIVVFGSFMFEDNRVVKLFGLGLALAVFLDATLVRMLLVPATMELLGARNWWLPRWLDRIIPNLNIEGTHIDPPSSLTGLDVDLADNRGTDDDHKLVGVNTD